MNLKRFLLAASAAGLLIYGQAHGHAMLENSSPADNAVLSAAPKSINLTFGHPTKLVMLKLFKGKDLMPITVDTSAAASKTFSIPLPALTPGQYQATWSTLSADGHPMKGILSFTISGN
jgi:methionine-rich copper-binding protein CopC